MLGYSREELLTKTTLDTNLDISEADQRRRFEAARVLGSDHVMTEREERFMRRKDGSTFPIEVARRYLQIGESAIVVGIARDITERKGAEQALRESEAKYRQLMEQAADGIYLSDAKGIYSCKHARLRASRLFTGRADRTQRRSHLYRRGTRELWRSAEGSGDGGIFAV